jgi:hypothetical protein
LIYLACGDPAILNIGVMIDPASSDLKKWVNYSLPFVLKKSSLNKSLLTKFHINQLHV